MYITQNSRAVKQKTTTMKLSIPGATGGIGRRLSHIALERGRRVTAHVRSPQKIGLT
jgi:putative NADH-flavin reductase